MVQGNGLQLFGTEVIGIFKTSCCAAECCNLIARVQKGLTRTNGNGCPQITDTGFNAGRTRNTG